MAVSKRKDAPISVSKVGKKQKTVDSKPKRTETSSRPAHRKSVDNQENIDDFSGFSDSDNAAEANFSNNSKIPKSKSTPSNATAKQFKLDTSSAEAHAKQRALAKERKASKPNADSIQRSKQLWEKLRRKSHVPKEERKELVAELFGLINGRVRDFVFKHDSVRVIQCAIKYARAEQLKSIIQELKGDVRDLAESRYGKFLVAKMVVQGDQEDKNLIVPEFYGHIKRLINHPEASWIVDDIYRQVALPQQKAIMLREWYGTEFALMNRNQSDLANGAVTPDLSKILEDNPEKRKPIMQYLHQIINNMIQKKMTGFTMLHDAMLQYFLAVAPGSEAQSEFLETLKGDIDAEEEGGGGDLYRNLAFSRSGSRLVCLALAHGSAKDRKIILRCFKDHIELMALDPYAKMVLATGLDVADDTRMTSQTILRELLGLQIEDTEQRFDRMQNIVMDLNARVPTLYPVIGNAKWLLKDHEISVMEEVHQIRATTSKKAPETRRQELVQHLSGTLVELISQRADVLIQSSFACQPVTEILLGCHGEHRQAAQEAIAQLALGDPNGEGHIAKDAATGRMLKTLVMGGTFDPSTKKIKLAEPRLGFGEALYPVIKPHLIDWACSDSSFVVVALLESEDISDGIKNEVRNALQNEKKRLQASAVANAEDTPDPASSKKTKIGKRGNAGARLLLEKIAS